MRVTVWNEFRHEKTSSEVRAIYPDGIHNAIKEAILAEDIQVTTATLDQAGHGLNANVLDSTDVLVWWGHMAHQEVCDELVDRVHERVLKGMGFIALHSGHLYLL